MYAYTVRTPLFILNDKVNNYDFTCVCYRDECHTPLSCAAEAGKHDIVSYLLSISGVTAEGIKTDEVIHFLYYNILHMYTSMHVYLLDVA